MPERTGGRLTDDDRYTIEEKIKKGCSARSIADTLGVHASSVTREVKTNRTIKPKHSKRTKPSKKCANYDGCKVTKTACEQCVRTDRGVRCRLCKDSVCCDSCADFVPRTCELIESWPYVCTCSESKRGSCELPKASYRARDAIQKSEERRSASRSGISVSEEELSRIRDLLVPLLKNGLSPEAIWCEHGDEIPIKVRTFYSWVENGIIDIPLILLPRAVRRRPRRKSGAKRERVDRTGRKYKDFLDLGDDVCAAAVQGDTIEGYERNSQRILSLHFPTLHFQIYALIPDGNAESVVRAFDAIETCVGSRAEFERIMGVVLLDRGREFDDFAGIEASVLEPGKRRCRVYYCDPMNPNQKPECERNHSELRRILPKHRSDFDALDEVDVAAACCHVNSYPRPALLGACPIDLTSPVMPAGLLGRLGIVKIPLDEVLLKPSMFPHAVKQ